MRRLVELGLRDLQQLLRQRLEPGELDVVRGRSAVAAAALPLPVRGGPRPRRSRAQEPGPASRCAPVRGTRPAMPRCGRGHPAWRRSGAGSGPPGRPCTPEAASSMRTAARAGRPVSQVYRSFVQPHQAGHVAPQTAHRHPEPPSAQAPPVGAEHQQPDAVLGADAGRCGQRSRVVEQHLADPSAPSAGLGGGAGAAVERFAVAERCARRSRWAARRPAGRRRTPAAPRRSPAAVSIANLTAAGSSGVFSVSSITGRTSVPVAAPTTVCAGALVAIASRPRSSRTAGRPGPCAGGPTPAAARSETRTAPRRAPPAAAPPSRAPGSRSPPHRR